jgi:hypothetical protein
VLNERIAPKLRQSQNWTPIEGQIWKPIDTRHCHEAATYSVTASHLYRHAIKITELIQEHAAHS